jgi:hypothetical protein
MIHRAAMHVNTAGKLRLAEGRVGAALGFKPLPDAFSNVFVHNNLSMKNKKPRTALFAFPRF